MVRIWPEVNASRFATDENEAEAGSQAEENTLNCAGQEELDNKLEGLSYSGSGPDIERDESPFARYCTDSAHVWKLYMDGAKVWDDELAIVLNGDLDPLLIFAGLFSAILSAFLIEIRKGLQEDLQRTTNTLLRTLIQEHNNLTTTAAFSHFKPTTPSRWINGLWFSSLIFSLMSALGASLAKGWVTQYASTGFGTSWRDAASHRRRFTGMKRWRMKVIIQSLPILIHIAFFLFAAGLVVLLFVDDAAIGGVVLALVFLIAALYIGSTAHHIFSPDSPFRTPVSDVINWLTNRSKEDSEFSCLPFGDSDSDAYKGQALAWLLTESADIRVIQETIYAIAGLPARLNVQDELYQSSVISVLSQGLSECIRKKGTDNSTLLNAHLHAILRLVQAGPRKSQLYDNTTRSILAAMVAHGGSLHVSSCNKLEPGVREVALCANARIHLMLFGKHDEAMVFIPNLLKSCTDTHTRRLLLEVYLLGGGTGGTNQEFANLDRSMTLLQKLKNKDVRVREDGHQALLTMAKLVEAQTTSVSTFNVGTLLDGLFGTSNKVRNHYVQAFSGLCSYEAFRQQLCQHDGIKRLYSLLKSEDEQLRMDVVNILERLANYDQIWENLSAPVNLSEIMEGLEAKDHKTKCSIIHMLLKFTRHDGFWQGVMTPEIVNAIVNAVMAIITCDSADTATRRATLDYVCRLAAFDDIRPRIATPEIVSVIVATIAEKDSTVRDPAIRAVMDLAMHDDIRSRVLTPQVVSLISAVFGGSEDSHIGQRATTSITNHENIQMDISDSDIDSNTSTVNVNFDVGGFMQPNSTAIATELLADHSDIQPGVIQEIINIPIIETHNKALDLQRVTTKFTDKLSEYYCNNPQPGMRRSINIAFSYGNPRSDTDPSRYPDETQDARGLYLLKDSLHSMDGRHVDRKRRTK